MEHKITIEGVTYTVTSEFYNVRTGEVEPYNREKHLDILIKQYIEAMSFDSIVIKDKEPNKAAKQKFICRVDENGRTECEIIRNEHKL